MFFNVHSLEKLTKTCLLSFCDIDCHFYTQYSNDNHLAPLDVVKPGPNKSQLTMRQSIASILGCQTKKQVDTGNIIRLAPQNVVHIVFFVSEDHFVLSQMALDSHNRIMILCWMIL